MSETSVFQDYFTDTGHLNTDGIALYAEALRGDRLEQLPVQILEHVEDCAECKEEIFGVYRILLASMTPAASMEHPDIETAPEEEMPDESAGEEALRESTRLYHHWIFRVAAIIVLLIGLAFVYVYFARRLEKPASKPEIVTKIKPGDTAKHKTVPDTLRQPAPEKPAITEKTQTPAQEKQPTPGNEPPEVTQPIDEQALAAAYESNPVLDGMTATGYRTGNLRVIGPELNKIFRYRQPVVLVWEGCNTCKIRVKIMNNKGSAIITEKAEGNSFHPAKALEPGLYYWILMADNNLVHVGKFLVK